MQRWGRQGRFWLAAALLGWMAAVAPAGSRAQAPVQSNPEAQYDGPILADAHKILNNKRFANVNVQVQNGVVTLTGQVGRYADKREATDKIKKLKEAVDIHNLIEVAVPEGISDQQLQEKLSKQLTYDRVGYGTTPFNAISLSVSHGVVTVQGMVVMPADKNSAMDIIANTAGVRDVVDKLQVAPLSSNDDRIRAAEFRAIYGFPSLNKYAIDPAKTIRIVVVNGHVTLVGVVDSKADSEVANLRANGVPGVFSVTNDLQVAGQEKQ